MQICYHIIGKQNLTGFIGGSSWGRPCISALPGRKIPILYFYTITMNKNQESEGVEFRILGRLGALCKEGLAMLAYGGGLSKNYFLSLCQIETFV